jgi:hypothetical protein
MIISNGMIGRPRPISCDTEVSFEDTARVWRSICDRAQGSAGELRRAALHSARVAEPLAGAKLFFLPPYSPDLNPIEKVFAKLKGALRKAKARTIDGVLEETARALPTVSAKECAGYFRHAGYAST